MGVDTHSDTILMDTRCHEILGYATLPAPLHVNTWKRLVHPDDRPSVLTTLQRQVALGQPLTWRRACAPKKAHGDGWRSEARSPLTLQGGRHW